MSLTLNLKAFLLSAGGLLALMDKKFRKQQGTEEMSFLEL
jgi:hypothetical protein